MPTTQLSSDQLRQALQLSEQIESLQGQLNSILNGGDIVGNGRQSSSANSTTGGSPLKGRKMSPATLRKMRAAQQARWATIRGDKQSPAESAGATQAPTSTGKKKGKLTSEGRAKLAAAMKARWAARKKGAPAPNTKAK